MYHDKEVDLESIGLRSVFHLRKIILGSAIEPLAPHVHKDKIEIIAMIRGKKTHRIDGRIVTARRGEVIVVFPGQNHGSANDHDEKSVQYCMTIYLHQLAKACGRYCKQIAYKLSPTTDSVRNGKSFIELIEKISTVVDSDYSLVNKRTIVLHSLTEVIILLSERCGLTAKESKKEYHTADIVDYIDKNIREPLSINDLAAVKNTSSQTLYRWFMSEHGVPPKEFVLQKKVEAARLLLDRQSISIRSCAYRLGFASENYFSTVFRRFVGKSPRAYMKQIQSRHEKVTRA